MVKTVANSKTNKGMTKRLLRRYGRVVLLGIVIVVMVYPFLSITSIDEEEFRYAVVSTVLHARSILDGVYPFWTSAFGFGMPHPFMINFIYHPVMPLFANHANAAILVMYVLHLTTGALGMWALCRRYVREGLSIVGVITYLLATPTLNFMYTDFWLTTLVGWSLLPWLYYFGTSAAEFDGAGTGARNAVALGLVVGLLAVNAHPSQVVGYVLTLILLLIWQWKGMLANWRLFGIALSIALCIAGARIYYVGLELASFPAGAHFQTLAAKEQFNLLELWSMFLRPLAYGNASEVVAFNINVGARMLFLGSPLLMAAIWGTWRLRKNEVMWPWIFAFVTLFLLYVTRPSLIHTFGSSARGWKDPVVIAATIVGLRALATLCDAGVWQKRIVNLMLIAQLGNLAVAALPFWWQAASYSRGGIEGKSVLRNILSGSDLTARLHQEIEKDEGRIYLSPKVMRNMAWTKSALASRGISLNSLPYFGMRVVNGVFKGISYDAFCPGSRAYGRLTETEDCRIGDSDVLNVGAIKYVVKFSDEMNRPEFSLIALLHSSPEGNVGLYRNVNAWPEAVFVSTDALQVDLPRVKGCGHGGALCHEWSPLASLVVKTSPIVVHRHGGDIELFLGAGRRSDMVIMVSEMYRSGWEATWSDAERAGYVQIRPTVLNFVGLVVPREATRIQLRYRDRARAVLDCITWLSLVGSVLFLLVTSMRNRFKAERTRDGN